MDDLDERMARLKARALEQHRRFSEQVQADKEAAEAAQAIKDENQRLWRENTIPAIKQAAEWVTVNLNEVGYRVGTESVGAEPSHYIVTLAQEMNPRSIRFRFRLGADGHIRVAVAQRAGMSQTPEREIELPVAGRVSVERVKELFLECSGF